MNPKLQKNLYVRTLGDEKVIYDKKNGRVHFMNSTATFILDLCDGTHSQEELVDRLLERYEVSREEAEKDVKRILKDMIDNETLNV